MSSRGSLCVHTHSTHSIRIGAWLSLCTACACAAARRYTFLLDTALAAGQPLLMVGPTGTGKSTYINRHLVGGLPRDKWVPVFVTLSARTTAGMVQVSEGARWEEARVWGPVAVVVGGRRWEEAGGEGEEEEAGGGAGEGGVWARGRGGGGL